MVNVLERLRRTVDDDAVLSSQRRTQEDQANREREKRKLCLMLEKYLKRAGIQEHVTMNPQGFPACKLNGVSPETLLVGAGESADYASGSSTERMLKLVVFQKGCMALPTVTYGIQAELARALLEALENMKPIEQCLGMYRDIFEKSQW